MGQQLLFTYGGHCLDKEIQGFRTLAVTGREELTQDIDDVDLASDGALYLSARLKQKTLDIESKFLSSVFNFIRASFSYS